MRKNCVIAAGGLGTRLKDFKDNKHTKVLIDINEFSMISTQIKQLKSWGFENFIVITNPDFNELIKNDVYENFENLNVNFVVQESPTGIADALSYAEPFVLDNSLITFFLCDNFFGNNPLINLNFEEMYGAHIFDINVDNPEEFGVMEMDLIKSLLIYMRNQNNLYLL